MVRTHPNSFFDKYGENDFEPLCDDKSDRGRSVNYILKYLEKSDERIVYSRGIPTELTTYIHEDDIICEVIDFVTKFILFNDVIDYETEFKYIEIPVAAIHKAPLAS